MHRHYNISGALALAILLIASGPALADISGVIQMCQGCHGEDGRGVDPNTPIIAGMPAIVQEDALYAYIDGDRVCGTMPIMCNIASKLTEDQVVELAEHFASLPYVPAGEEFDAALAEAGKTIHDANCAICHGAGDPSDAQSSVLHGQRKNYLRYALQQYVAGERTQLPAMETKVSALSDDDIEALLNYYASYEN